MESGALTHLKKAQSKPGVRTERIPRPKPCGPVPIWLKGGIDAGSNDNDSNSQQLVGESSYALTFPKGQMTKTHPGYDLSLR